MYGLSPTTIHHIREVFALYPGLDKATLYGSRAMGTYRPGSDIDLTLEGEQLDLTTLHQIENELDDLLLPYKMDLSLLKHINNPELLDHIQRVGKVFYERENYRQVN